MNSTGFSCVKSVFAFLLITVFSAFAVAQSENVPEEEQAIRTVIQSAYVEGLQNWGDIEAIRAGFHPSFELLSKTKDNEIQKLPIGQWIEMVETRKAQNTDGPEFITSADILEIDITVDAASVKLDLIRNEKRIFTDYLLLYKFKEGWRIVGKIYYKIPQ
ncbi:MAG: nuclear transport factor 2 family protein [Bacteroidales bacterium]|nr:nuclear transport factor 2 family protein [Bacteroidales bacterium]